MTLLCGLLFSVDPLSNSIFEFPSPPPSDLLPSVEVVALGFPKKKRCSNSYLLDLLDFVVLDVFAVL
jgi:hypothetical protein